MCCVLKVSVCGIKYEQEEKTVCKSLNFNSILTWNFLHHIVLVAAKEY